jgi:kynureninase
VCDRPAVGGGRRRICGSLHDVTLDRSYAESLDAADPLAPFRDRFAIADDGVIYLAGNSLGRLPTDTSGRIDEVVREQWGRRLIRSWSEGWMDVPLEVGDRLGAALLGARPGETVVCDNVTLNIFKVLHAALSLRPDRTTIVVHRGEFPTDRYVAAEAAAQRGASLRWIGPLDPGAVEIDPVTPSDIAAALHDDVAAVLLSVVDYRSAALVDVLAITRVVHDAGAVMIWDCSHAVGSVPLALADADADLAIGCTYKYVNGGPGAPAFIWANERLHDQLNNPVPGWMGHADVFAMGPGYRPAPGIRRFMTGTPSAIALAAVDVGVGLLAEAGMPAVRAKSVALTSYAVELADTWLAPLGVALASPRDAAQRGSHITLRHPDAQALTQALTDRGVIPDFRHPDGVRVGLAPLTTRFVDVHDGLLALRTLVEALHS